MSAQPKRSAALSVEVERNCLGAELALALLAASADRRAQAAPRIGLSIGVGRLSVCAAGEDVVFRSNLDASTTGEGELALDARTLVDIVRRLPSGPVRLSIGRGRRVVVQSAGATFRLVAKDSFVATVQESTADGETLPVPVEVLRDALDRTAYAMTEEESRFTLAGVRIEIGSGRLRAVATDGRRLALYEQPVDRATGAPIAFIAPRGAVPVLRAVAARSSGVLAFSSGGEWTRVCAGHREVRVRSMAGTFPACDQIVPASTAHTLTVPRAEFETAIRRAALIADPAAPAVRLTTHETSLVVSASRPDTGELTDSVPVEGDAIDILVSSRYLTDFLSRVGGESIRVGFGHSRSPLVFCPVSEPFTTLGVLMPMA